MNHCGYIIKGRSVRRLKVIPRRADGTPIPEDGPCVDHQHAMLASLREHVRKDSVIFLVQLWPLAFNGLEAKRLHGRYVKSIHEMFIPLGAKLVVVRDDPNYAPEKVPKYSRRQHPYRVSASPREQCSEMHSPHQETY